MQRHYKLPDLSPQAKSQKRERDYARELCVIPFFNLFSPFWILIIYLFCPKFSIGESIIH